MEFCVTEFQWTSQLLNKEYNVLTAQISDVNNISNFCKRWVMQVVQYFGGSGVHYSGYYGFLINSIHKPFTHVEGTILYFFQIQMFYFSR